MTEVYIFHKSAAARKEPISPMRGCCSEAAGALILEKQSGAKLMQIGLKG
jgi:hypothetical protein